jgi:hypothetical protein
MEACEGSRRGRAGTCREREERAGAAGLCFEAAVDVTVCPHCADRMRLVKLATTREELDKALAHAGLGPRPPPRARPVMLGQLELSSAA